jgi:hypothetical protein
VALEEVLTWRVLALEEDLDMYYFGTGIEVEKRSCVADSRNISPVYPDTAMVQYVEDGLQQTLSGIVVVQDVVCQDTAGGCCFGLGIQGVYRMDSPPLQSTKFDVKCF